jgi:Flp pilus assembly protein TadG
MRAFRRARGNDFGASAVEFALIFPIFMILVLGTIAAGTAFSKQLNVTQAVREASRYGATLDYQNQSPAMTLAQWLTAVDNAAVSAAGNANDPIGGFDYRCVALVTTKTVSGVVVVDSTKSQYLETIGTAAPTTGAGSCPSTRPALIKDTDYVQVAMYRKSSFFALFFNPTIKLDSVSTTPYEGKAVP